jgi:hypothetical protein
MTSRTQSHLELFNQIQYAHSAFAYGCEDGMPAKDIFRFLCLTAPTMTDQIDLNYGDFSDALKDIAASFGCKARPAEEKLRGETLSPEMAYAMILHVIDRTATQLYSDKQFKQIIAPTLALANLIKRWGVIVDDKPLIAETFKEQGLLMARMAFRRQGHELDCFNEKKALVAIDRACQKLLSSDELKGLPQRVQYIFVNSKIKLVGYNQGLSQASALAVLKNPPDNKAYHELDPTTY